jgi:hypothetical protein
MAYDGATHQVILFGGTQWTQKHNVPLNETWAFSNGTWSRLHPVHAPVPSADDYMCYDPAARYPVLYHGVFSGGTVTYETWSFQRGDWVQLTGAGLPLSDPSGIAYDPAYKGVILVGGVSPVNNTMETWLLQNGSWGKLKIATQAPHDSVGVSAQALVYDSADGYLVLVADGRYSEHTWKFSQGNWTAVRLGHFPSVRGAFGMTFDAKDSDVLQFGGDNFVTPNQLRIFNQTWSYG